MIVAKSLLHRVQNIAIARQTFNCGDRGAIGFDG
jgi:hypothetical protein